MSSSPLSPVLATIQATCENTLSSEAPFKPILVTLILPNSLSLSVRNMYNMVSKVLITQKNHQFIFEKNQHSSMSSSPLSPVLATIQPTCENTLSAEALDGWTNTTRRNSFVKYSNLIQWSCHHSQIHYVVRHIGAGEAQETLGGNNSTCMTQTTVSCSS